MPEIFERAHALQEIDTAIECMVYAYVLASDPNEEDDALEDIEQLGSIWRVITSNRYLYRNQNRLSDVLNDYIFEYSDIAFLALFRMHRESFWKLVHLLT